MKTIISLLSRWLYPPELGMWIEIGQAANHLGRLSASRPDLQIVLYQGQFRIGYADEAHGELDQRIGTCGVGPDAWDWQRAYEMAASTPRKAL